MEGPIRRVRGGMSTIRTPDFDIGAEFQAAIQDWKAGRLAQAEQRYHRVLNASPDHANAHHNLGLVRLDQGLPGAALPYLLHAAALQPDVAEIHNTLANAHRLLGKLKEAEAGYRRALELKPGFALAWYNLGVLFSGSGRTAEAKDAYRQAIAAEPAYRDAYVNLGNLLREEGQTETAIGLTEKALAIDPRCDLAHNNLGNMKRDLDQLEEAAACYRRAIECNPKYLAATINLGTVLAHLGRNAESAEVLRRAIGLAPERGEAYFQLAHETRLAMDDPLVGQMERVYSDRSTPDEDRMFIAFALGRIADAHNQYDQAFGYWQVANRLRRAQLNFDIRNEAARFRQIKARFSKEFLQSTPRSAIADETPIFIVGMIRSGTTLTEQILASHPDVVGADEVMWFQELAGTLKSASAEELTRVGRDYIGRLRKRFGQGPRFIIDKMLGNILHVGLIHLILPQAKIIRVFRNPCDSLLSAYSSYFVQYHEYIYDMTELADYYALHRDLVAHWDMVLPGKIYHQRYEDLVADPEGEVRKLLAHCGLPFSERCLAFHENARRVRTASAQQVREKMHNRSIGRWRNYEKYLQEWKSRFGEIS
jgi:tetratricopeptide (TPR) repeat protein